jgi:ADP-heptose:LPS heptosyltransferase
MKKNILIVHSEGIGDSVLALPFLSLLPGLFPGAILNIIVGRGRREIYYGLEKFVILETHETNALRRILAIDYDIVFDLNNSPKHVTEYFTGIDLKYKMYVGFVKPTVILNEIQIPFQSEIPRWKEYLNLILSLNPSGTLEGRYSIATSKTSKDLRTLLFNFKSKTPIFCIAPGASSHNEKRWPVNHFADVISFIKKTMACRIVLLGDISEIEIGDKIIRLVKSKIHNLIGITTIGCAMEIINKSAFVIANDNGLLHVAGLLNVPAIGLFGPTSSSKWHPLGDRCQVVQSLTNSILDLKPSVVIKKCLQMIESDNHLQAFVRDQ